MPAYKDSNGKWYCKFYFTDWNGEKKQKKKSGFNTQREAKAWERNFLESKKTDSSITISDLCDKYLDMCRIDLKPLSIVNYEVVIRLHIKPMLGHIKACNLTPLQVKEYQKKLLEDNSPIYVNNIHKRLSAVINFGIKYYGLTKNPCTIAGGVKIKKEEMRFITVEEFEKILSETMDKYKMLFSLLFWTGMRLGEALALTPADLQNGTIRINKNKVYANGKNIIQTTPKTANSIRSVELHEGLYKRLKQYSERIYDSNSLMFPFSSPPIRQELSRACAAAEIPRIRVHDLRHSHVSLLIHLGYSPNAIGARIGDTAATVLNVYAHVYDEDKKAIANNLQLLDNSESCF